jgi:cytochrome c oxidase subunit 3
MNPFMTLPSGPAPTPTQARPDRGHGRAAGDIGLWVFIGVASSLFSLFIAAYLMRMDSSDWSPIALPWQLWLSSALLLAGSIVLQRASVATRTTGTIGGSHFRSLLLAGGACALAFLIVQSWAWRVLLIGQVGPNGNPAGSFFYLLTAMHGLHVAGGLVGWAMTVSATWRNAEPARIARLTVLCTRYWHFLLVVWIVLFGALGWVTPELIRTICGTR